MYLVSTCTNHDLVFKSVAKLTILADFLQNNTPASSDIYIPMHHLFL